MDRSSSRTSQPGPATCRRRARSRRRWRSAAAAPSWSTRRPSAGRAPSASTSRPGTGSCATGGPASLPLPAARRCRRWPAWSTARRPRRRCPRLASCSTDAGRRRCWPPTGAPRISSPAPGGGPGTDRRCSTCSRSWAGRTTCSPATPTATSPWARPPPPRCVTPAWDPPASNAWRPSPTGGSWPRRTAGKPDGGWAWSRGGRWCSTAWAGPASAMPRGSCRHARARCRTR